MTTTRIILVSFMVNTLKNVTGNSQLPVRIKKSLPRSSAPVTSIEEFPQRLLTSCTIAIIKMIESQAEWVYFIFKLSQKWKHFLGSHSERVVA